MADEIRIITMPKNIGAAFLVLAGEFGNGVDRVIRLEEAGYDYNTVQDCVNDLIDLIEKYED